MIEEYASSVYNALIKDLSDIEEERFVGYGKERKSSGFVKRRPYQNEIEIYSFPQGWSSTALGFGGIGGQAMTSAITVVVIHYSEACVYFGGRFAYKIKRFNSKLWDDIRAHDMHEVAGAAKRYEHGN